MLRRRLLAHFLFLSGAFAPAQALNYSVTDFKLDYTGSVTDTFRLDHSWGDSLLLDAKDFRYKNALTKKLNTSAATFNTGASGASTIAGATGLFSFKVAYISWDVAHIPPGPGNDAPPAKLVVRNIELSPDTAMVEDTAGVLTGLENVPDIFAPHKFNYLTPNSPPPPSFLNFVTDGARYAAYWGTQNSPGPIRRTSYKDFLPGGSNSGKYVTPAAPDSAAAYGKVSAAYIPGSGGTKTVLAYEASNGVPTGSFRVRWEDIEAATSVSTTVGGRATLTEDFAVAADSSGNSVVLWHERAAVAAPIKSQVGTLFAVAYDNSHAQIVVPVALQAGVFARDSLEHWYRPFAIMSMNRKNFLIAYSRPDVLPPAVATKNVIYYRTFALTNIPPFYSLGAEQSLTAASDYCMYPDMAISQDRVVMAWFQRAPQLFKHRLMGSIFKKQGVDINTTVGSRVDLDFAGEDISFGGIGANWYRWHWLKTASVAMDEKGNVVAAYDSGTFAKVALIRNTPIYYDSAIFLSKTFQVTNPAIPAATFDPNVDSVDFLSITGQGSDTGNIGLQLAAAPTAAFVGVNAAYLALPSHRVAATGFYRYRAVLKTIPTADTNTTNRTTPKLKSLSIDFNVKPRMPSVDSIKTGSTPIGAYNPATTYSLLRRKDSLKVVCSAFDMDDATVEFRLFLGANMLKSAVGTKTSAGNFTATMELLPPDTALNPLPLTLAVVDDKGWSSNPKTLSFVNINIVPTQTLKVFQNRGRDSSRVYRPIGGGVDTLNPAQLSTLVVQVGDTLTVRGTYTDGNDANVATLWRRNSTADVVKTIPTTDTLTFKFPADTVVPLIDTLTIGVGDKDTTVFFKLLTRTNRIPTIDSIVHSAYKFKDSTWKIGPFDKNKSLTDTGLIVPSGLPTVLDVSVSDQDLALSDSVAVKWISWRPDTGCVQGNLACYLKTDSTSGTTFTHTFSLQEQYVTVRATDKSGAFKERKIWMEYPIVDTTGSGPAGLASAVKILNGDISFILGSKARDTTVKAELASSGSATLQIFSVTTKNNDQKWLDLKLEWQTTGTPPRPDSLHFGSRTTDNAIPTGKSVLIASNAKLTFSFTFFTDSLRGDSTLTDTLLVQTNDFANPVVKIPFHIKYDDLPVLRISIPGAKPAGASGGYNTAGLPEVVPTRSTMAFSFSETVKVKDPAKAFQVYSLLDSLKTKTVTHLIAGDFAYRKKSPGLGKLAATGDSLADTIIFTPKYDRVSDSMKVKPAPGFFIYRDILHIRLSNGITDKAGNSLDLRLDRSLQKAGSFDTVFQAQVDTGVFQVDKTEPAQGSSGWNPDQAMRIHFNRRLAKMPPLGTDSLTRLNLTSLKGDSNQSVRITSVFQGNKRYNFQFLSLENGDSTLVIKTRPRFPALDTVTVVISGGLVDTSGLSLDGNGNKFPEWLYTRLDTIDQYTLTFQTIDQNFYIFPNPYRFSDSRHRDKGSITFKNLNTLSGFVKGQEVVLRVHTMTGDLIYNSHDAPAARNTPKPDILNSLEWDLKNVSGSTVGTGVYIFTLMTGKDKVLRKGKVAVVR